MLQRFNELADQLAERMAGSSDTAALFHQIQSDVIRAKRDELENVVCAAYDVLGRMQIESESRLAFPDRSAHLVLATDLLIRRARLPAILFRFDQDPDAMKTIAAVQESEGPVRAFASSSDWYQEITGVVHYLGPLLGCLSPRLWCFPASRPMAVIRFSLGRDINGLRNSPMELMQLLPGFGRDEPIPPVAPMSTSCRRAIDWWVTRLSQMFGYLLDPTTFKDSQGHYDHHDHQHWMLTIGQVFGLSTALQTSGRNHSVQRGLMYTLLDTYADKIKEVQFDELCRHTYAKAAAERVRQRMPADVAEILMPVADRAVDALARVQEGFFIQQQRDDENINIGMPDGKIEQRTPERGTAMLLKVFRNATHGFGHRKGAKPKNMVEARLLAHHHGDLPPDIVFLPYLYLLDMLCSPQQVRESVARQVARPD